MDWRHFLSVQLGGQETEKAKMALIAFDTREVMDVCALLTEYENEYNVEFSTSAKRYRMRIGETPVERIPPELSTIDGVYTELLESTYLEFWKTCIGLGILDFEEREV